VNRAAALLCAFAVLALAGCSSRPVQAPVVERAPPRAAKPVPPAAAAPAPPATAGARPEMYTVKRGDTLFSIALDQGLDYKELAAWNNLDNANVIRPGQQLRIKPPAGVQEAPVIVRPVTSVGRIEGQPLGAQGPVIAESKAEPKVESRAEIPARPTAAAEMVKSEPQARKLPYSPENIALLQRGDAPAKPAPEPALVPAPPAPGPPKPEPPKPELPKPELVKPDTDVDEEDRLEWGRPAQGKIIAGFSEATNKGLDIAGSPGDAVIAAAPGRVVYSGSGLRGYGKLVIIKHNKTFLSAYAHNRDILVKEGQSVVKGQKIAEIGSTDADLPKLHFEIRKLGKPVDPAKYLPAP
jgi:lipoprotein NlpD